MHGKRGKYGGKTLELCPPTLLLWRWRAFLGSLFTAPGSYKPGMLFDSSLARLLGTLLVSKSMHCGSLMFPTKLVANAKLVVWGDYNVVHEVAFVGSMNSQ